MADASTAYARPASTAGIAAKRKAGSTFGPIPGTCLWIMKGMTLMPAPIIEQTPVATRPSRPISRASPDLAGTAGAVDCEVAMWWRFCITGSAERPETRARPLPELCLESVDDVEIRLDVG